VGRRKVVAGIDLPPEARELIPCGFRLQADDRRPALIFHLKVEATNPIYSQALKVEAHKWS